MCDIFEFQQAIRCKNSFLENRLILVKRVTIINTFETIDVQIKSKSFKHVLIFSEFLADFSSLTGVQCATFGDVVAVF